MIEYNPMDRRNFLTGTASLAGLAAIPGGFLLQKGDRAAPSERIRIAMLGVGSQGFGVMRGFAGKPDVQVVAVCDPFKKRCERAKAWLVKHTGLPAPALYADYRKVMERTDIDAVVICSCDHWHVPLALAAAESGKDMYVEKPLSLSLAWSFRLREAVRRNHRVFQYGTMQRSSRVFRHTCELLRNGHIGKVLKIDAWCPDGTRAHKWMKPESQVPEPLPADLAYDLWLGPAPAAPYNHWRVHREGSFHTYAYSIGFLGGWGSHPLDIAQWALDMDGSGPVSYRGQGKIPTTGGLYSTVYDWDVHCRYATGVKMHFMSHKVARPVVMKYRRRWCTHGTTFFGTEGWVSVDRAGIETSRPELKRRLLEPGEVHLKVSRNQGRDFLDCIKSRAATVNPLESAIRSDTISHLSDIAIRTGRTLEWDPVKEEIVGNPLANRLLHRPMRPPYLF